MSGQPSTSTLRKWRRDILAGTASEETQRKLFEHVVRTTRTTGCKPTGLMDAWLEVACSGKFNIDEVE